MAELPSLLRRVDVAAMPDADWAGTQTTPAPAICVDVRAVKRLGVVFVAYDAAGAVVSPSGTMDVALVDVAATVPPAGKASTIVIKTTPVDAAVVGGAGLEYDVAGSRLVTMRIAADALDANVAYVDIWWNCLE